MRHGFKAHAKRLAIELREEIELDPLDPLDPWKLADLYGIDVYDLNNVGCSADALSHFTITNPEVFSGALIPLPTGAVILENPSHPVVRRRSTMAHELAHVLLEHAFSVSLVNEKGCRNADRNQEDEAAELSGELLLPFEAAKRMARSKATDEAVADQFEVSTPLARWRLYSTGARKIAARQSEAYARKIRR
ncbi:MAG TPA: ImmA/IrrE family metallo-endopeptidase [Candidatus Acidoferrum sp.]|nr:ImmA/IrrE family metallo-endopeptidase [Candidatus Acidoferrum sp.]